MKRSFAIQCFLLSTACWAAPSTTAPSGLTIEEAKRRAATQNYEILAARHFVTEREAAESRARSAYWPRLGVAGGVDHGTNGIGATAGFGYGYGSVNLFRGFSDLYETEIAALETEKAKTRLKKLEFRIGLEVERPFYQFLFLQRTLALRKEALDLNETHKALAHKRKSVSLVSETDVMEYELRDALLRSDIASLEQDRIAARLDLQRVMGSESPLTEDPVGTLAHWHLRPSLTDLTKKAEQEGEAPLLAKMEVGIAEIQSKRWMSKWWPEIDADAQVGQLALDNRPATGGTSFRGLLLAKWELFSGFESSNQRREEEARRLRAEAEAKGVLLSARTSVAASYRKLRSIEARVHLEENNRVRAKRYYESVLREYRSGVRNSADVRQAAESLYEASLRREKFKFDFLFERIELEKTLGGPIQVDEQPEGGTHPEIDIEGSQE